MTNASTGGCSGAARGWVFAGFEDCWLPVPRIRSLPLTDVQYVLCHAASTTTQLHLTPRKEDVVRRVLPHHAAQTRQAAERVRPSPAPGYRPETLQVLFGNVTP